MSSDEVNSKLEALAADWESLSKKRAATTWSYCDGLDNGQADAYAKCAEELRALLATMGIADSGLQ